METLLNEMEGDNMIPQEKPSEKLTVVDRKNERHRTNSAIPLKVNKPKAGSYVRSAPPSPTTKVLNRATLEMQFSNNKRRLLQMIKDLDTKQQPIMDLYKTLLRTKNQLENLGKTVKIDDVEIIKTKLNQQQLESYDQNNLSIDDILNINKNCLLKFESFTNNENNENLNDLKEKLMKNQELLTTLTNSEKQQMKIKQLQEDVEKEKKKSNYLMENLKKTADDNQNHEKTIKQLQNQIAELENELKTQKATMVDNNKKHQNVKFKLFEFEKKSKENESKLKQIEDLMKSKEEQWLKEKDELKKKQSVLQQKCSEKQKQIDTKESEYSGEITKIQNDYENKFNDLKEKIVELTTNNQQLLEEQQNLINKNTELTTNFNQIENEYNKIKGLDNIDSYLASIDSKENEINLLRKELHKQIQLNDELKLSNQMKLIQHLRNLLKWARDEIVNKNRKIQEILEKMLLKEQELNRIKQKLNEN